MSATPFSLTKTPAYTTSGTATSEPDPRERAEHHANEFSRACSKVRRHRDALQVLFGEPVAHSLEMVFEDLTENADEAMHYGREALKAADVERAFAASKHADELARERHLRLDAANNFRARIGHLEMLLRFAVGDVEDRYKRSKRAAPAWLADAIAAVEPDTSETTP